MLIAMGVLLLLPQVGTRMEQRNVAFEADYETRVVTIGSDGARRESCEVSRLYRDARGRTRLEGTLATGDATLRFAFLTDFQKHRSVVLDLATGKPLEEAHRSRHRSLGRSLGQQAPVETGGLPEARSEDLGEAQIEGLAARGVRTITPSSMVEVWMALQIDQPPLLVRKKESSGEETQRLFNIRIGDPDPRLFAPLDAP